MVLPLTLLATGVPGARADESASAGAVAGGPSGGGGGPETAEKKAPKAPATVEAQRGPFTVTLELSGTYVPRDAKEVAYRPEAYGGELEVVEAVEAGPVVKGQTLVRFETDKID